MAWSRKATCQHPHQFWLITEWYIETNIAITIIPYQKHLGSRHPLAWRPSTGLDNGLVPDGDNLLSTLILAYSWMICWNKYNQYRDQLSKHLESSHLVAWRSVLAWPRKATSHYPQQLWLIIEWYMQKNIWYYHDQSLIYYTLKVVIHWLDIQYWFRQCLGAGRRQATIRNIYGL